MKKEKGHKSLRNKVINSLLAYFSLHKEKNNKGEFINTIHYILDIIPSIETIWGYAKV